jgi:small GTP-binding protein
MGEFKGKIVVIGAPAVGKTSLVSRFVLNKFSDTYLSTLGTHVSSKRMNVGDTSTVLQVWDLAGQKKFQSVRRSSYIGSIGALAMADLSRLETSKEMNFYVEEYMAQCPSGKVILVGNKCDLASQDALDVFLDEAWERDLEALITSAKTGEGVDDAFTTLAKHLIRASKNGVSCVESKVAHVEREDPNKPLDIHEAQDRIISSFSWEYGDEQVAMAIVREQYRKVGMDFREPTIEGLRDVVENLLQAYAFMTKKHPGPLKRKLHGLIRRIQ